MSIILLTWPWYWR